MRRVTVRGAVKNSLRRMLPTWRQQPRPKRIEGIIFLYFSAHRVLITSLSALGTYYIKSVIHTVVSFRAGLPEPYSALFG